MRVVATTNAKPFDCLTFQHQIVPFVLFYCSLTLVLTIGIIARGREHAE